MSTTETQIGTKERPRKIYAGEDYRVGEVVVSPYHQWPSFLVEEVSRDSRFTKLRLVSADVCDPKVDPYVYEATIVLSKDRIPIGHNQRAEGSWHTTVRPRGNQPWNWGVSKEEHERFQRHVAFIQQYGGQAA